MAASPSPPRCLHLEDVTPIEPRSSGCEACLKAGDTWVQLRVCLGCGRVGCCDASKNQHASNHYQASGHPLIRSLEPGDRWIYCFVDEVTIEAGDAGEPGEAGP